MSMTKRVVVVGIFILAGCGGGVTQENVVTRPPEDQLCGSVSCVLPQVCVGGTCMNPPPTCGGDDECSGDTYCDESVCVPYGVGTRSQDNPACGRPLVVGVFTPATKCRWTASTAGDHPDHRNVLTTPLVADFNFDNDATTTRPSIVFTTYNCDDGACGEEPGCYGVIRIVDGATCQDQFTLGSAPVIGSATPAIGDLDGDGRPDVVAKRIGGGVVGWRYDQMSQDFVEMWPGQGSTFNGGICHWDGLAVHDLDDDGAPEIVEAFPYPAAYDSSGRLIDGSSLAARYSFGIFPVAADVDGDGQVELLTGDATFRFDKIQRKWASTLYSPAVAAGHTAIADFGSYGADPAADAAAVPDGVPEVVVVAEGTVRLQTLLGRIVYGPIGIPAGGKGGPPTVADFDGDQHLEIGVAGIDNYAVFDPDCLADPNAMICASLRRDGILWQKRSQDHSSSETGSAVFDFDGDGQAEVVYADECFSRIYQGKTGDVVHSQPHTSCTWYENPTVADVDGDFKTEIVIPSNSSCSVVCPALDPVFDGLRCVSDDDCPSGTSCGKEAESDSVGRCRCSSDADCGSSSLTCVNPIAGPSSQGKVCRTLHAQGTSMQGIEVLHDVRDRWVGSRAIWNQHTYAVTNVRDDGTIPRTSDWSANWTTTGLNNFRANVQGKLGPLVSPDITAKLADSLACTAGRLELVATVCNRGAAPVAAGVPISFYQGASPAMKLLCQAATQQLLAPGACETVSCEVDVDDASFVVTVVADDDGQGRGATTECSEGNNADTLSEVCLNIP